MFLSYPMPITIRTHRVQGSCIGVLMYVCLYVRMYLGVKLRGEMGSGELALIRCLEDSRRTLGWGLAVWLLIRGVWWIHSPNLIAI